MVIIQLILPHIRIKPKKIIQDCNYTFGGMRIHMVKSYTVRNNAICGEPNGSDDQKAV